MHMISSQYSGESVDGVQDDVSTTQHIVKFTMLVYTILQNKTSLWLLNFILYISVTATIING